MDGGRWRLQRAMRRILGVSAEALRSRLLACCHQDRGIRPPGIGSVWWRCGWCCWPASAVDSGSDRRHNSRLVVIREIFGCAAGSP